MKYDCMKPTRSVYDQSRSGVLETIVGDIKFREKPCEYILVDVSLPQSDTIRRYASSIWVTDIVLPNGYGLNVRQTGGCGYDLRKAEFSVAIREKDRAGNLVVSPKIHPNFLYDVSPLELDSLILRTARIVRHENASVGIQNGDGVIIVSWKTIKNALTPSFNDVVPKTPAFIPMRGTGYRELPFP